jgi:HSP20 family protein
MGSRLTKLMQSLVQSVRDPYQQSPWQPPADVYRIPGGWLAKFDLAGIRPQDVELSVSGRSLTVSGVRRDRLCQKGHRSHSMEISYNRFQRSIQFPGEVEGAEISVEYQDGMLMVRLAMEQTE